MMEQDHNTNVTYRKYVTNLDIWALGITTVIGGQYFLWNAGLEAGLISYVCATIIVGLAYFCLCLCTSEISSTLPFAGGAYGLARCTLGYYPGFLIGCFESLQYIIYVSTSVTVLSSTIISSSSSLQPLIWICLYGSTLMVHIHGGSLLWRFNLMVAMLTMILLLMYCIGSFWQANLSANLATNLHGVSNPYLNGGVIMFIRHIPTSSSFYLGVQSLNLASDEVEYPKVDIPKGQLRAMGTLFISSFIVLLVTVSLPHNEHLITENAPLNQGYITMFNLSSSQALLLSIPAMYSTMFGFMFIYSKVLYSMAESKLLPGFMVSRYRRGGSKISNESSNQLPSTQPNHLSSSTVDSFNSNKGTPIAALLTGGVVGLGMCTTVFLYPNAKYLFYRLSNVLGFVAYIAQCIGFVQLRTRFRNLPREFKSPFGIAGAVYALFVFGVGSISLLIFQEDNWVIASSFASVVVILSLYYYVFAKNHQKFSSMEQKIMFVAHVINNNLVKRLHAQPRRLHKRRIGLGSSQDRLRSGSNSSLHVQQPQQQGPSPPSSENDNSSLRSAKVWLRAFKHMSNITTAQVVPVLDIDLDNKANGMSLTPEIRLECEEIKSASTPSNQQTFLAAMEASETLLSNNHHQEPKISHNVHLSSDSSSSPSSDQDDSFTLHSKKRKYEESNDELDTDQDVIPLQPESIQTERKLSWLRAGVGGLIPRRFSKPKEVDKISDYVTDIAVFSYNRHSNDVLESQSNTIQHENSFDKQRVARVTVISMVKPKQIWQIIADKVFDIRGFSTSLFGQRAANLPPNHYSDLETGNQSLTLSSKLHFQSSPPLNGQSSKFVDIRDHGQSSKSTTLRVHFSQDIRVHNRKMSAVQEEQLGEESRKSGF